jgi:hypothetical protein
MELYNHFPDAKWFILIDDDTYLFMENVHEYLSQFDHTMPYYLGNPNMFVGCDGVSEFGQGPLFAHGGSGIILSRGALEKMKPVASQCIQKYKDCFAGDVRLALCLRDVGVFVESTDRNHLEPPNDHHHFGSPCEKPLTFHHLTVSQIQKLYQAQESSRGLVRNQDIVPFFFDHQMLKDQDRKGDDYSNFDCAEPKECAERCEAEEQCVAYVHVQAKCFLKDRIPSTVDAPGAHTGVVIQHYKCE